MLSPQDPNGEEDFIRLQRWTQPFSPKIPLKIAPQTLGKIGLLANDHSPCLGRDSENLTNDHQSALFSLLASPPCVVRGHEAFGQDA
ncbi:hypothetical protein ACVIYL_000209 [Bradyrhizobium sp. USDA 3315]